MSEIAVASRAISSIARSERIDRCHVSAAGIPRTHRYSSRYDSTPVSGRDVIGQAQTGTGKIADVLPLLDRIDSRIPIHKSWFLLPRENWPSKSPASFDRYAQQLPGFKKRCDLRRADYQPQISRLRQGVHVVVGTPGRVMDHMRRGTLALDNLSCLVLDEADEMLRMGFVDDVEWVMSQTPMGRQIALFSATMPKPIRAIAQKYLKDPVEVAIEMSTKTAETVHQRYLISRHRQKFDDLTRVLEGEPTDGVIIFVRTKSRTVELAEHLVAAGHKAVAINGDMAQSQRERSIEQLKDGKLDVLVATDVAARGLDVQRISHVVNFDLPRDTESYIHRIGRTGRAGRSGQAILFVEPREKGLLRNLEKITKQRIEPMRVPSAEMINSQRIVNFKRRMAESLDRPETILFGQLIQEFHAECPETSIQQIAAALACMAQGDTPLLMQDPPKKEKRERKERSDQDARGGKEDRPLGPLAAGMDRFRLDVGRIHGVLPKNIVGAIANETGLSNTDIGRIKILRDHTIVDLPMGMPKSIFQTLKRVWVAGRQLNIAQMDAEVRDREFRKHHKSKPKSNFGKKRKGKKPAAAKVR
ncbi:MAG: helicase-related protein [Pirellulaceae bacterium]